MSRSVRVVQRTAYFAPTKRRHYFTAPAAAKAEATARLLKRFPTERDEFDDAGRMTSPGFHFSENEVLLGIRDRLARRILRNLRSRPATKDTTHGE